MYRACFCRCKTNPEQKRLIPILFRNGMIMMPTTISCWHKGFSSSGDKNRFSLSLFPFLFLHPLLQRHCASHNDNSIITHMMLHSAARFLVEVLFPYICSRTIPSSSSISCSRAGEIPWEPKSCIKSRTCIFCVHTYILHEVRAFESYHTIHIESGWNRKGRRRRRRRHVAEQTEQKITRCWYWHDEEKTREWRSDPRGKNVDFDGSILFHYDNK